MKQNFKVLLNLYLVLKVLISRHFDRQGYYPQIKTKINTILLFRVTI